MCMTSTVLNGYLPLPPLSAWSGAAAIGSAFKQAVSFWLSSERAHPVCLLATRITIACSRWPTDWPQGTPPVLIDLHGLYTGIERSRAGWGELWWPVSMRSWKSPTLRAWASTCVRSVWGPLVWLPWQRQLGENLSEVWDCDWFCFQREEGCKCSGGERKGW